MLPETLTKNVSRTTRTITRNSAGNARVMKIPLKSTHRFVFVSNLKDPLAGELNPFRRLMEAFLLSETYSTQGTITLAKDTRQQGCLIVSDNGNFSRMKKIAGKFERKGMSLCNQATKEANNGGVSSQTLKKRKQLIDEIEKAVVIEQKRLDISRIIGKQLQCDPHYIIGMEDFTIPVLQLCGLFNVVFSPRPGNIRRYQKQTQIIYQKQRNGDYDFGDVLVNKTKFLVCHAYDFDSAVQARKLYDHIQADSIAISFGASLASRSYIQKLKMGRTTYRFDESLPESYLLSIALTLGVSDRAREQLPIHILGLGTPILIILIGLLLRKTKVVSIDSTATYKDADDGNLYGSKTAFLKMDMYKVAAHSLISGEAYDTTSPWFRWFNERHPASWDILRSRLQVLATDDMDIVAKELKKHPKLLEQHSPFFTPMRSGADPLIKEIRVARAGTNFWVLKNICARIRQGKSNPVALGNWVDREVSRYAAVASPKWALAVQAGYRIIKEHGRR